MFWGVRSAGRLAALVALSPGALSAAEIRWSGAPECRRELEVAELVLLAHPIEGHWLSERTPRRVSFSPLDSSSRVHPQGRCFITP
ncbi:MAG: hypothetical protein K0R38_7878, partial [Polyangiaceae bacterium]|nr:hypothetical protein [Polyangiaceae bacterium]